MYFSRRETVKLEITLGTIDRNAARAVITLSNAVRHTEL